jgi:hypothetical protein
MVIDTLIIIIIIIIIIIVRPPAQAQRMARFTVARLWYSSRSSWLFFRNGIDEVWVSESSSAGPRLLVTRILRGQSVGWRGDRAARLGGRRP